MRWLVPFYKIWPISPTMSQGSYLFCLSILPVRNIMLHIQKSVKKKKKKRNPAYQYKPTLWGLLWSLVSHWRGVVLQRNGSLHLKNSHPPEVESGIHNHDSLMGLGWLLRLLTVWNDKVNGRFWLLEENSQLDLNLLGPEKRDIWGGKDTAMNIQI